jgi:UDP-glucose 4-epimerase
MIQAMEKHKVQLFVFSSTCAVYGLHDNTNIEVDDIKNPVNPYGETKLVTERMLNWVDNAHGIRYVSLRYFNACGADAEGDMGESHFPEIHVIPVMMQVALGKRDKVHVFGTDYNTRDGTCIRDFIHVTDLSTAHIRALEYLADGGASDIFNLGSGSGSTVNEVLSVCRKVTGRDIPAEYSPRRPGDPDSLVASPKKAEQILGWKRQYTTLEQIVKTAWNWHLHHPDGYK